MKGNLRIILYALAAGLAFMLWQQWQLANQPKAPAQAANPTTTQAQTSTEAAGSIPAYDAQGEQAASGTQTAQEAQGGLVHVTTDLYDITIDTRGATIVSARLLDYATSDKDARPLALLHTGNPGRMLIQSGIIASNQADSASHFATWKAAESNYKLGGGQNKLVVPFTYTTPDGVTYTKSFTFERGTYNIGINQIVQNHGAQPWDGFAYQQIAFGTSNAAGGIGHVATFTGFASSTPEDRYNKIKLDNVAENESPLNQTVTGGWVAMMHHYFVGAIVPPQTGTTRFYTQYDKGVGDHIIGVRAENTRVAPGEMHDFSSTLYLGPKIEEYLSATAPYLDKTIDYGWLFIISQFMFKVMKVIHDVVGNWGWCIILTTILIKLIFFFPSAWAYKSMAKMRALQPEMMALKERTAGDRQAMSQGMMKLYREHKVNPASGCLPMLLQIPFFIAFYWVLAESAELRMAPWIFWIHDLSVRDPYYILPIINAALMFLQQRLNPPPPDPTQAKIMMMLPLVFGFMFMWFPAGLVLYWTVSNAFSIVQQYVMNKRYGGPIKAQNHHKKANA